MEQTRNAKAGLQRNMGLTPHARVQVKDDNGKWVDFSRAEHDNMNRVLDISPIKHTIEKHQGVLQTESGTIVLRNDDGFFSKPFLEANTCRFAQYHAHTKILFLS